MAHTDDLVYAYDGTYDGMLCCVWAAFFYKENPCEIWLFEEEQPTLYRLRQVDTAAEPAQRVQNGIRARLGARAEQWVLDAWYSALPRRELAILEFLKLGFAKGPCVTAMPGHPQVAPLYAASRALHNEAHLLTGFLRFTDYGGTLVARIRPKNQVLPFLEPHFSARFPRERYLIYDETHHCALAAAGGKSRLARVDSLQLPAPDSRETDFQALWKQFYDTIEIQARHNPRCRMTHVPQRYWLHMDELRGRQQPLPVSVRQALAAGELTLPGESPPSAILTPTQASLARADAEAPLLDAAACTAHPTASSQAAGPTGLPGTAANRQLPCK